VVDHDWTGAQAAAYPHRLRAFSGFNPLKPYAHEELERCARDPHLRHRIKLHFGLHFGSSDGQLDGTAQVRHARIAGSGAPCLR
jgi:predicted TIM-barrel fold metal-dependent hydrolase